VDWALLEHAKADSALVLPSIERLCEKLALEVKQAWGDRGLFSAANEKGDLQELLRRQPLPVQRLAGANAGRGLGGAGAQSVGPRAPEDRTGPRGAGSASCLKRHLGIRKISRRQAAAEYRMAGYIGKPAEYIPAHSKQAGAHPKSIDPTGPKQPLVRHVPLNLETRGFGTGLCSIAAIAAGGNWPNSSGPLREERDHSVPWTVRVPALTGRATVRIQHRNPGLVAPEERCLWRRVPHGHFRRFDGLVTME
jgi:hypothetical protein